MPQMTVIYENESGAKHGYTFGVDGFMSMEQACDFLACSRDFIERLCNEGKLRRGKMSSNRVRICKRSMSLYAKSIES